MDYIIQTTEDTYFLGWDPVLGKKSFTADKSLAYRMRRPVAINTLDKLTDDYPNATILKVA